MKNKKKYKLKIAQNGGNFNLLTPEELAKLNRSQTNSTQVILPPIIKNISGVANLTDYKNKIQADILKKLSSGIAGDGKGNFKFSSNIDTAKYLAYKKLLEENNSPDLNIDKNASYNYNNPITNTITLNDPHRLIDELSHSEQYQNNGLLESGWQWLTNDAPTYIKNQFYQDKLNRIKNDPNSSDFDNAWINTPYNVKGTLENDAHDVIQPKLENDYNSLYHMYEDLLNNKQQFKNKPFAYGGKNNNMKKNKFQFAGQANDCGQGMQWDPTTLQCVQIPQNPNIDPVFLQNYQGDPINNFRQNATTAPNGYVLNNEILPLRKQIGPQNYNTNTNSFNNDLSYSFDNTAGAKDGRGNFVPQQKVIGDAIDKGFNYDSDGVYRKNEITTNESSPLGYNSFFKTLNTGMDLTQVVAGMVNEGKTRKEEHDKLMKARYSTASYNPYEQGFNQVNAYYQNGGGINIQESHKGRFTKWAKEHNMSVLEAAKHVMANKDRYNTDVIKMANFAKNFAHQDGGMVNNTGYTPGTESYDNPYNIIPSGNITMEQTPFPVMAYPENGDPTLMHPGQNYNFKGSKYVTEVPMQNGGKTPKFIEIPMPKQNGGIETWAVDIQNPTTVQTPNGPTQIYNAKTKDGQSTVFPKDKISQYLNQPNNQTMTMYNNNVQNTDSIYVAPNSDMFPTHFKKGGSTSKNDKSMAAAILQDGEVHGTKLTPKQKKHFKFVLDGKIKMSGHTKNAKKAGTYQAGGTLDSHQLTEFGNFANSTNPADLNNVLGNYGLRGIEYLNQPYAQDPNYAGNAVTAGAQQHWVGASTSQALMNARRMNIPPEAFLANKAVIFGNDDYAKTILNNKDFARMYPNYLDVVNNLYRDRYNSYKPTNNAIVKKQTGGDTPEVEGVGPGEGNAELEQGEVYQTQQGGIQKIGEDQDTHEEGGALRPDVSRVLEDTSDKRKDKDSKALRITPVQAQQIVGFKPKGTLTHSKLYEKAVEKNDSKQKSLQNTIQKNLDYIKQNGGKYAQNSLELNLQMLQSMTTSGHIFDAVYNHQEQVKQDNNITNDQNEHKMGGKFAIGGSYKIKGDNHVYSADDLKQGYGWTEQDIANQMDKGLLSTYDITPYSGGNTTSGRTTPTGLNNTFSFSGGLPAYKNAWQNAGLDLSGYNTNADAQSAVYDNLLKNNPDVIRQMWKQYGNTAAGIKQGLPATFDDKYLSDPNNLSKLKTAYADNLFGVRTLQPGQIQQPVQPQQPTNPIFDTGNFVPKTYGEPNVAIPSQFNEPLRWYDTAGDLNHYLSVLERIPVSFEQLQRQPLKAHELNPLPTLDANQGDYNAALATLPNNGVGYANQANLLSNKYKVNNEVLGQYATQNNQIADRIDEVNNNNKYQLDQTNLNLRNNAEVQQSQGIEIQRQAKLKAFDDYTTKLQQNSQLNRNGNIIMQLTPYFDENAKYNGNKYTFQRDSTGAVSVYETSTGKLVKKTVTDGSNGYDKTKTTVYTRN